MNPKQRKKEPPDPSSSLYVSRCGGRFPSSLAIPLLFSESTSRHVSYPCLNLCHCSVHLLSSGLHFLLISVLSLPVLEGTRSPASIGSCARHSLLLVSASSASQFGTNRSCVALGGSPQYDRVCLWVHQMAQVVDGAVAPLSPVFVLDLKCLAQPVVEEECYAASVAKDLGLPCGRSHLDMVDMDTSNRFAIAFILGSFQVCGLLLYLFTILFDLLWSIGDPSLLGYFKDFVLPPCYFGCFHGYVSVGCKTHRCMFWYSALRLTLAASFGTVGNGSFWDLHQISVFIVLILVSPIAYTLLPDQGSTSWYFALSMILSNTGLLVGNFCLPCSLPLGLKTSNLIWPVCGQCLLCCISIGLYLWLVWFITQHCYVIRMCLMTLELHRRMLGLAHRGPGSNRYLVPFCTIRLSALFSLLSLAWLLRLWWQGLWFTNPSSRPLCMRPCLLFVPS